MPDLKVTIRVLYSEIIHMEASNEKNYQETRKRLNDMKQTISALETDIAKHEILSN